MWNQCLRSHLSTVHGSYEGTALIGTRANSLGPALPEQTGHGGFIRQAEPPPILEQKNKTHMLEITVIDLNANILWL